MTTDAAAKEVSIWEALDSWGKSLPGWQKFTVAHAVRDGSLSDERIEEGYAIYLRGAQLTADTTPLATIPVSITGRADGTDSSPVLIAGIKNPVNVNAIPSTAELNFGCSGSAVQTGNELFSPAFLCIWEPRFPSAQFHPEWRARRDSNL